MGPFGHSIPVMTITLPFGRMTPWPGVGGPHQERETEPVPKFARESPCRRTERTGRQVTVPSEESLWRPVGRVAPVVPLFLAHQTPSSVRTSWLETTACPAVQAVETVAIRTPELGSKSTGATPTDVEASPAKTPLLKQKRESPKRTKPFSVMPAPFLVSPRSDRRSAIPLAGSPRPAAPRANVLQFLVAAGTPAGPRPAC